MNIEYIRNKITKGQVLCVEITKEILKKAKDNQHIGAYNTICEDEAIYFAKLADENLKKGLDFPLLGVPFSAKDNICTNGIKTTCSSKMLKGYIPSFSSTAFEKLINQSGVLIGKNSMDEFAMGSYGQHSSECFAKPKNPYDMSRVSGGSSGGSAVAVSANLCAFSLGTDTGGSVVQPSSMCGVTGIKPTYGTISRFGIVAYASSFDQIGIIANGARDCAYVLNVVSGFDPKDHTSVKTGILDYTNKMGISMGGVRIGVIKEFFTGVVDDKVKEKVMEAIYFFEKEGAKIVECSLPSLKHAVSAYYLLACSEASSNLARFDGIRYGLSIEKDLSYNENIKAIRSEGFGKEVKKRILLGNYALSSGYYDEYYKKAMQIREKIKQEYEEIFEKTDVLITPTSPSTAPKINRVPKDGYEVYASDVCTVTANITGIPVLSTTCGYDDLKMPIGMSISAKHFQDDFILAIADFYEKNFTRLKPKFFCELDV